MFGTLNYVYTINVKAIKTDKLAGQIVNQPLSGLEFFTLLYLFLSCRPQKDARVQAYINRINPIPEINKWSIFLSAWRFKTTDVITKQGEQMPVVFQPVYNLTRFSYDYGIISNNFSIYRQESVLWFNYSNEQFAVYLTDHKTQLDILLKQLQVGMSWEPTVKNVVGAPPFLDILLHNPNYLLIL